MAPTVTLPSNQMGLCSICGMSFTYRCEADEGMPELQRVYVHAAIMSNMFKAPHRDFEVILAGVPEPYTPVAFTPSRISLPALKWGTYFPGT